MTFHSPALSRALSRSSPEAVAIVATLAAFLTYACMYAFRRPFAAANYEGEPEIWGIGYKAAISIAQVVGYALSKFMGIKVISEMGGARRAVAILGLIGVAELAMLGFAVVPAPYNAAFLLLNGIPLGFIWGLVFSYIEGRRFTEIMGLGLSASFILSSGFVRDVGIWLMNEHEVSAFWMPFVAGMLFALPLILAVWLLDHTPPPTPADEALRTKRLPMTGKERIQFFRRFAFGLTALIASYLILTAYRDVRDKFQSNIWSELRPDVPAVDLPKFSSTEIPVGFAVLGVLLLLSFIKGHRIALIANHLAMAGGMMLAGGATWAFHAGLVSDYWWILLTGFGAYVAYFPFNSILFDRFIAAFRQVSNVGFLIYLADSFGYLGTVGVLLYKELGANMPKWVPFFTNLSYFLAVFGGGLVLCAMVYFDRKLRREVKGE